MPLARTPFNAWAPIFFVPHCVPRFSLPADGAYFMIGYCFARGLESVLANNHFNVRSVSKDFDRFQSTGVGTPLGATNRYNTGSILNEFRWALDPAQPFQEKSVLDIDERLSFDPHMNPTLKLADRCASRRAQKQRRSSRLRSSTTTNRGLATRRSPVGRMARPATRIERSNCLETARNFT
jgi:hypothetical protein